MSTSKIVSIQALRALAALGVVWFHASSLLAARTAMTLSWSKLGSAGVDLFFIVSGFIMWKTAIDRDERVRDFALKRIMRIVPLYWLTTALVLTITLLVPGLMHNASHDLGHFVASFFFIAWPHPALPGHFWPPVVPGWTLNYEALFYGVVAISLALRKKWRLPFCAALLVGLSLCHPLVRPEQTLAFYTDPILLEFLFGLILGATRVQLNPALALTAVICGAGLFLAVGPWATDDNRTLMWGVPLTLLALGVIKAPAIVFSTSERVWVALGDASYSLYLTQFLVLPPAAVLASRTLASVHTAPPVYGVLFVTALVAVGLTAGLLTYRLIEQPILKLSKRLLSNRDHVGRHPTPGVTTSKGPPSAFA